MIVAWSLVCSFLNRFRGGLYGDFLKAHIPFWGTTTVRLVSAGLMVAPVAFNSINQFLMAWLVLYLGFIPGWKAWQYMDTPHKDIFSMGLRGLVTTVPLGIVLGSTVVGCSGLLMGLVYFIPQALNLPMYGAYIDDHSSYGEFFFGAILGAAIWYATA